MENKKRIHSEKVDEIIWTNSSEPGTVTLKTQAQNHNNHLIKPKSAPLSNPDRKNEGKLFIRPVFP